MLPTSLPGAPDARLSESAARHIPGARRRSQIRYPPAGPRPYGPGDGRRSRRQTARALARRVALQRPPLVTAAAIVGSIFGAGLLGPLADKLGRRRIFRLDLILFIVFSVACVFAWDVWSLIGFRFLLGIAIGLDYPIAASYLAEVLPASGRGRWLVSAFSLQAIGILLGAIVGVVVLELAPDLNSWRWMLGFGAIPALIIVWLRRGVPESPRWLAQNGHERRRWR